MDSLTRALEWSDRDLRALGLAWARAVPVVALVPAFGLRAVPRPVRIALGLSLAVAVAPALRPLTEQRLPWSVALIVEMLVGLPIALSAATALWVASMAGGLVDNLRQAHETSSVPTAETGTTPAGVLLSLIAALAFLQSGGPARVAQAIGDPELSYGQPLARAALQLTAGIELAVAIAAPLVAASIIVEVTSALVARAMNPAFIQPLLGPLRSVTLLAMLALVLDRVSALLAQLAASVP